MAGLARICKMFGAIIINGERHVWDYAADIAVPEKEMPFGSKRYRASEIARFKLIRHFLPNSDAIKPN